MTRKQGNPENGQQSDDASYTAKHDIDNQADELSGNAEGSPADVSDPAALAQQLAEKEKEVAELKDKYLRSLADSENARKRIRQQSEESVRLQKEALLRDLLPIVDNLERAIEAARGSSDPKSITQGVDMVLRTLLDFLRNHGVTPVHAVGQTFDPFKHEAVDHVESDSHAPNTVVSEVHRGYQLGDRTLRPARVTVAKGSGDGNPQPNGESERNGGEN
jgi:molecular chaperone GrpE